MNPTRYRISDKYRVRKRFQQASSAAATALTTEHHQHARAAPAASPHAAAQSAAAMLPLSRSLYNLLLVSVAFLLLFSAYNALQNVATSLFPAGLGNSSLGILYAAAAVGVFLAPPLVDAAGTRVTMIAGAACYVVYMACLIPNPIISDLVLAMSVVIGLGAAVLWVALGEFIKENSDAASYGRNAGLFWAIFQLNNIVGNLGTYLVFPHLTNAELYAGFSIVGAAGTALLLVLRKPAVGGGGDAAAAAALGGVMLRVNYGGDDAPPPPPPAARVSWRERGALGCASVLAAARLLLTLDSLLLLPMYLLSGFELAFWTGEFTQLLDASVIGLVLTLSGVGEVAGGLLFGRLSDALGRSASISLGALLYAGGLGLACWVKSAAAAGGSAGPLIADAPLAAYAASLLFGLGDSAFNTNCYAIISQVYGKQVAAMQQQQQLKGDGYDALLSAEEDAAAALPAAAEAGAGGGGGGGEEAPPSVLAFTIFQLAQNAGSAACYYVALQLPMHGAAGTYDLVYMQAAMLALGTAGFVAVAFRHRGKQVVAAAA